MTVTNFNDDKSPHGYWESTLWKGNYIHGKMVGYWEWYDLIGITTEKEFYL